MLQNNQFQPKMQKKSSKHQSLQLNRLIKFIQNKKSPNAHKLKHILLANQGLFNEHGLKTEARQIESSRYQNSQRQYVAVNTKNIFVAKNKTQANFPRLPDQSEQNHYKVFKTKQEIRKLYKDEFSQQLPPILKEKLKLIEKDEENRKSNLLPPLIIPKYKKAVSFKKQEDEATRWLNTEIRDLKENAQKYIKVEKEQKNQAKNLVIFNLKIQRQRCNSSLRRLIQNSITNSEINKYVNNNFSLIQGIEGYDRKLIVQGEQFDRDQEKEKSSYALKGRLLANKHFKTKKSDRQKSQVKAIYETTINLKNPQSFQGLLNNFSQLERKKQIFHTNRQAYHFQSPLKMKTQITAKHVDYQPCQIRNLDKTFRLIKQIETNMKDKQKLQQQIRVQSSKNSLKQKILPEAPRHKNKSMRKSSNFQAQNLKNEARLQQFKKSLAKWQLVGYEWGQSSAFIEENTQLEKYVQKMIKKKGNNSH